ncbi:hypothetical protein DFH08DRAFT_824215 [Mycena albidolilacea]|uniref:Uncharacterized protein n=1 Tax=Mycena albidolilacea TaxID=1033008 RepID=A0AAD7EBB8_9AGAR|nr:hypothetical protein DFH08DRAFT_824215 [Mycena albidolilacea]
MPHRRAKKAICEQERSKKYSALPQAPSSINSSNRSFSRMPSRGDVVDGNNDAAQVRAGFLDKRKLYGKMVTGNVGTYGHAQFPTTSVLVPDEGTTQFGTCQFEIASNGDSDFVVARHELRLQRQGRACWALIFDPSPTAKDHGVFLLINALFVAGQPDGIVFSGRATPAGKNKTDEYCTVQTYLFCPDFVNPRRGKLAKRVTHLRFAPTPLSTYARKFIRHAIVASHHVDSLQVKECGLADLFFCGNGQYYSIDWLLSAEGSAPLVAVALGYPFLLGSSISIPKPAVGVLEVVIIIINARGVDACACAAELTRGRGLST